MIDGEVARRLVHLGGVVFPLAYLLDVVTWPELRLIYLAGSMLAIGLETVRLWLGVGWSVFDRLTREYERSNVAGYALYTFSSTAVVLAFDPRIALPAVLMLVIADPVSGLLGTSRPGETKEPLVLAVMFVLCFGLALMFVGPIPAGLGAAAATVADGTTPVLAGHVIDDNLTIPPAAAVVMWLVVQVV